MNEITQILESLENLKVTDLKVYIVTRHLKDGVSKSKKMLDKWEFDLHRIEIDKILQQVLFENIVSKINEYLHNKVEYELREYEIAEDGKECLYTYNLQNKVTAFNRVFEKIATGGRLPALVNIDALADNVWTYCLRIKTNNNDIEVFRRVYKSAVSIVDEDNKTTISKKINSFFNTTNHKLEMIEGRTFSFDTQIDFIRVNGKIYIFKKGNFEDIVNLEQEFREKADECLQFFKSCNLIEGVELIENEIAISKEFNKKLAKIFRDNNHLLDANRIHQMREIAKKFKGQLKGDFTVINGKVKINNPAELKIFIQMLDDYFLSSMQNLGYYGSHNKSKLLN